GEIGPSTLPRVLAWLGATGASGCLVVEHEPSVSRVFFREGRPCGAIVMLGFKPLGLLLLEHGVIGLDELEASLIEVSTSGRPQGAILVEWGHIDTEQLAYWLWVQQRDRLHRLLAVEEGSFHFDEEEELPPWTTDITLSAHQEILAFLSSESGAAQAQALLEDFAGVPAVLSSFDPAPVFDLNDMEKELIGRLACAPSIEEVVKESTLEPARSRGLLAALYCFHYLTPFRESEHAPDLSGDAIMEILDALSEAESKAREAPPTPQPPPELSSWRAPVMGRDHLVRYGSPADVKASIDIFIKEGALLVATGEELRAGEPFDLELVPPRGDSRPALTCALSAVPEEGLCLLRIVGGPPIEEVIAVLEGKQPAVREAPPDASEGQESRRSFQATNAASGAEATAAPHSDSTTAATAPAATPTGGAPPSPIATAPAAGALSPPPWTAAPTATTRGPPADSPASAPPPPPPPPIPLRAPLRLPTHPAELLSAQAAGGANGGEKEGVSPLHLLWWLGSSEEDFSIEISAPKGFLQSFEVLAGAEVQSNVEIASLARPLTMAGAGYEITRLTDPPSRRQRASLRALSVSTTKAILRIFDDDLLEQGLGPRLSLCPRLSSKGRRLARRLHLSSAQLRLVSHSLDGTRLVDDVLHAGIGRRAAWEILYLLEMRDGLEWTPPPPREREDAVTERWQNIQGKDLFAALGLHWSSHPGLIEKEYARLAKLYGPRGRLRGTSPKTAQKLWARIEEARNKLSKRQGRMEHRRVSYPGMNFEYQAELLVGQARLALVRGEVEQTRLLLESALDLAPVTMAAEMLKSLGACES
ncbi:MAG: DUF4388 domain-containing protein, partial [Myxococcota bacterium]